MIQKLRRRFIAMSILALFLVLLVIMGTVNILNYRKIVQQADSTLQVLAQNQGTFPKLEEPMGHGDPQGKPLSPELPYESRYFSVLLEDDGTIKSVDTGKISAIDSQTAIDFAQKVVSSGKQQGFLSNYRYTVIQEDTAQRAIFLDCTRDLSTFYAFLWTSCGISLLGISAVFILILLFSWRIIRPVSESYEKQRRFITDAGHELKTPLTILAADAQVLQMEVGDNPWIEDMQQQTKRLALLTNELINLSRMEEDSPLQKLPFSLSDVVGETAQSFLSLAQTQKKKLEIHVQPMLTFVGDEKSLRQLCSILLDNAIKYSPMGGDLEVQLEKRGKNAVLQVRNTCEPIKESELEHLFDRFYRADPSRNSQTGGYGLGLSIAKAIVQAHRGKISATLPQPNQLCMEVVLPMKK